MCVTRYGIHLCERCASAVTSPFCSTRRSDIYYRQGAWPAPYICWSCKASCGLRTVAMSLNAISCRVNASATSDEMPPSVTRRPSNLSACATVLSTTGSARVTGCRHPVALHRSRQCRCLTPSVPLPPAVAGDGARRRFASVLRPAPGARICHASVRLAISSTTGRMPPAGVRRFQLNLSASSFSASLAVVRALLPSLGTRCDDAQRPSRLSGASPGSPIFAWYKSPIACIELL
jgi:hypothetical protein